MRVLALNCGSSSVKFQLFETGSEERCVLKGAIDGAGRHHEAIEEVLAEAGAKGLDGIGHRVVHGGEYYSESVLIDDEVERRIEECSALAPLHNPHNLAGFRAVRDVIPEKPNVAVFDTAFHQSTPRKAYLFGLPWELYREQKIRRYGFHGTSHRYVSLRFAEMKGARPAELKVIICHLGSGSSVCAVDQGRSVDSSMGFTPLDGLMMGTRPGLLDPGVLLHLMATSHTSVEEMTHILNKKSGLLGISGLSDDMRTLIEASEAGNERARTGIEVFCYRIKKYIGTMFGVLNGADAVLFTGGIGENSPLVRAWSCEGLEALGISIDTGKNESVMGDEACISNGKTEVWVTPTNEELLIARETVRIVSGA